MSSMIIAPDKILTAHVRISKYHGTVAVRKSMADLCKREESIQYMRIMTGQMRIVYNYQAIYQMRIDPARGIC